METNFTVIFLNEEGQEKNRKEYKTYSEISKELNLGYHLVRDICLLGQGLKTKKFKHQKLINLMKKIQIKPKEISFDD